MVTGRKFLIIFKNALKKAISEKGNDEFGGVGFAHTPIYTSFPCWRLLFSADSSIR
jgi:hypothetical protein